MGKDQESYDKEYAETQEQVMVFVKDNLTEEDMGIMGAAGESLAEKMPNPGKQYQQPRT